MPTSKELEKQVLDLPPAERERLARMAWHSLADDADAMADASLDEAGIELARQRDGELAREDVKPISAAEFRRRSGGG